MIGGCGVLLDGLANYVTLGVVAARDFTASPYTLSLWVYPTSTAATRNLIAHSTAGVSGYDLIMLAGGQLRARTHSPATTTTTSSASLVANRWQHVTVVRNGSSIRLYIDGEDVTGVAGVHANPVAWGGATYVGCSTAIGGFFPGAVDEPAFFNRALSHEEVRRLLWFPQLVGTEAGLVSYHRFDDGLTNYASTVATAVVSGVNGTLTGGATWVFDRWAPWVEKRIDATANVLLNAPGGLVVPGSLRYFIPRVASRLLIVSAWDLTIAAAGLGSIVGQVRANGAPINGYVTWTPLAAVGAGTRLTLGQNHTFDAPASTLLSLDMLGAATGACTALATAPHTGYALVAQPSDGNW